MRFIVFFIFLITLFPAAHAQEKESLSAEEKKELLEKDFNGVVRGFVWGLPPTLILEEEEGTFLGEENGALFFLDYIRGLKCTIAYEFSENKLWRIRIFIEKNYFQPQDRLRDLLVVQADLDRRYGKPVKEEFKWVNEREKDWPDNWGWAVYRGELFVTLEWQDKETDVTAFLGARKKFEPQFNITYESRAIKEAKALEIEGNLLKAP